MTSFQAIRKVEASDPLADLTSFELFAELKSDSDHRDQALALRLPMEKETDSKRHTIEYIKPTVTVLNILEHIRIHVSPSHGRTFSSMPS